MPAQLRYGADSSVRLELRDGVLLAECGAPQASPLEDPAGATAQALAEPLDYLPLTQSMTPADRVVFLTPMKSWPRPSDRSWKPACSPTA